MKKSWYIKIAVKNRAYKLHSQECSMNFLKVKNNKKALDIVMKICYIIKVNPLNELINGLALYEPRQLNSVKYFE